MKTSRKGNFAYYLDEFYKKMNTMDVLKKRILKTELGEMLACASNDGICFLEFLDQKYIDKHLGQLSKQFSLLTDDDCLYLDLLQRELDLYFKNQLKYFSVPLAPYGTNFQLEVWKALTKIEYGHTCSYGNLAERIKKPSAVRAVANANAMNKIAILIPCHRVIGSDGSLTGYASGIFKKRKLLELEQYL